MSDQADRAALLAMDVQPGIIDRTPDPADYLARVTEAVWAARGHAVAVIHVIVGFRPGMPEVSARNHRCDPQKACNLAEFVTSTLRNVHPKWPNTY
jgi:nicotinamidase-related amidase